MTPHEASDLATRINQTWPRGLTTNVWEEELKPLDPGRAGTAIARLRRTETTLTIARFWTEYTAINTTDASTREHHKDCTTCENTGWQPVTTTVPCADGTTIELDTAVKPCHCPRGRDREQIHHSIVDGNEAELDRLHPNRHTPPNARSAA